MWTHAIAHSHTTKKEENCIQNGIYYDGKKSVESIYKEIFNRIKWESSWTLENATILKKINFGECWNIPNDVSRELRLHEKKKLLHTNKENK